MFGLFVSSVFFLPIFLVCFLGLWWCSENDQIVWSVFLTAIVGWFVFEKFPEARELFTSPLGITVTVISYLLLGIGWASVKWIVFLRKTRTQFINCRDEFLGKRNLPGNYFSGNDLEGIVEKFIKKLGEEFPGSNVYSSRNVHEAIERIKPKIRNSKTSVIMWIGYWPLSLVWFIINDAVREIAETIYNYISGVFQRISDRMFKDLV